VSINRLGGKKERSLAGGIAKRAVMKVVTDEAAVGQESLGGAQIAVDLEPHRRRAAVLARPERRSAATSAGIGCALTFIFWPAMRRWPSFLSRLKPVSTVLDICVLQASLPGSLPIPSRQVSFEGRIFAYVHPPQGAIMPG
jgi:hypothetical protein